MRGAPCTHKNAGADLRRTLIVQGGYYVATGIVPFVSRRGFEAVTGPKREWWLVQTVGGLVGVMGIGILRAAAAPDPPDEVVLMAKGSALVLAAIDVVYVAKRRIAPTYLVDAGAQLGIAAALFRSPRHDRRPR